MKDIILVGSGGCMREIVWQMLEPQAQDRQWNVLGYTDIHPAEQEVMVCGQKIPYLGTDDYFDRLEEPADVAITVGNPALRKKIADRLKEKKQLRFPAIVLGNAYVCSDAVIGEGCILCDGVRISTNVRLGAFVFCNIGATVCHDGVLEDFVTISPHVNLAGDVRIGRGSDIGIGTSVIQGIRIGEESVLGAGSVVIRNIAGHCVCAGVPAHLIRQEREEYGRDAYHCRGGRKS